MTQVSLFISNFKTLLHKKIVKTIGYLALMVFVILFVANCLNYIYTDAEDSFNQWSRILWHNYYSYKDNIDCLYIGSSHIYEDIDPYILDELNGKNNFDFATPGQRLNASYYILKEIDKKHDLEHVYLELYYDLSTRRGDFSSRDSMIDNWRNIDEMKFSLNKLLYIFDVYEPEYYLDTFLPFIRYKSMLFDNEYVDRQVRIKCSEDYRKYRYRITDDAGNTIIEFTDKGYDYTTEKLTNGDLLYQYELKIKEQPVAPDAEKYLGKILEYCRENNIAITLFSSPVYELHLLATDDYDAYIDKINSIAREYDIEYYDFNICREEYMDIQSVDNFKDVQHLNTEGAAVFTDVFWEVMSQPYEESSRYFYTSYADKRQSMEPCIYGIYRTDPERTDRETDTAAYRVASNRPQDMEYRILLTPAGEDTEMYQDFSQNTYFSVPDSEHGICTIVAKVTGQSDKVQTLEINY